MFWAGDTAKPKAWSKYAAEKVQGKKSKEEKLDDDEPKAKRKKKEEEILEKAKDDPDFAEFLESHVKKAAWGNDTVIDTLESMVAGKKKKKKYSEEAVEEKVVEDAEEKVEDIKVKEIEEEKAAKKKEKKKVVPEKEFFTVKLRNLPKKTRKKDLKTFFAPLSLKSIR